RRDREVIRWVRSGLDRPGRRARVRAEGGDMPILDQLRLGGRGALVTGAGPGLGGGGARGVGGAGADVALVSRSASDLERVAADARALGRRALVLPTDLSNLEALPPLVERVVAECGTIDVLANVAGIGFRKDILKCTPADWDQVMNVHLPPVYFLSQSSVALMQRQGRGQNNKNCVVKKNPRGHGVLPLRR